MEAYSAMRWASEKHLQFSVRTKDMGPSCQKAYLFQQLSRTKRSHVVSMLLPYSWSREAWLHSGMSHFSTQRQGVCSLTRLLQARSNYCPLRGKDKQRRYRVLHRFAHELFQCCESDGKKAYRVRQHLKPVTAYFMSTDQIGSPHMSKSALHIRS